MHRLADPPRRIQPAGVTRGEAPVGGLDAPGLRRERHVEAIIHEEAGPPGGGETERPLLVLAPRERMAAGVQREAVAPPPPPPPRPGPHNSPAPRPRPRGTPHPPPRPPPPPH